MAVVIAAGLDKDMAGEPLLRGVSFKLERGDRMTLAGRNGAGKTTLLRMVSGQTGIDGVIALLHPEVSYRYSGAFPDAQGEAAGHEELRRFWHSFRDGWERVTLHPEEVSEHGERVLVRSRFIAEGRSGVRVDMPFFTVFSFRDGLISEYRGFRELAEAEKYANE